jgi:glycosyltransferase involved in cell wall biosynthesis
MRILYLAPFTAGTDHFDSGVVGYGQTSGGAIVRELERRGHQVDRVPRAQTATSKSALAAQTYTELGRLDLAGYDCLFMYNTFHQFAAEVRRLLDETGAGGTLLTGYTHGSHWDPSDEVRHGYPMLKYADLGNVLALDVVFLVSHYMLEVMSRTIEDELGPRTAAEFTRRARVVGGTIDAERIDAARVAPAADAAPVVVFNHSATVAKRPERFFRAAGVVLAEDPAVTVAVTRRFRAGDPGHTELAELAGRYPDRLRLGDTMPIEDYFTLLWQSQLQVSTATHESFGVSTVEAIYAGCSSLLPAAGCYPEVAGQAGLYDPVLAHDPDRLAAAILAELADSGHRAVVAKQQRASIERYLPAVVAGRIEAALVGA